MIFFKGLNIRKSVSTAFKEFFKNNGLDRVSILAYYSIFSFLFLITFFIFVFSKILGNPSVVLKSMYPFSPEFFNKLSPDLIDKAKDLSGNLAEIGVIGVLVGLFLAFLIIKKVVQYINEMFGIDFKTHRKDRHFFIRRFSEFSLIFLLSSMSIVSFFITGLFSTITSLVSQNEIIVNYIEPGFIRFLNHMAIQYIGPFLITFIMFFVLYKWIPEKKVYVKGAVVSALFSTVIWEVTKRIYAYYLINISVFGKLKGSFFAIIIFGFWMEISMGIMLFGAKLTSVFDRNRK